MSLLDIFIIVFFLAITLVIGVVSSRKITSFAEYAIGNRNFSTTIMITTISATIIDGGATVGFIGKVYEVGLIHTLVRIGYPIAFLLMAILIVPKMSNFYGNLSVGEMLYKPYGLGGQLLGGITSFLYGIGTTCVQIVSMGHILSVITSLSYTSSVFISSAIIIFYSTTGGVKSVTFTDALQFLAIVVIIPIIYRYAIIDAGGYSNLINSVPKSHLKLFENIDLLKEYIPLMLVLWIPSLSPPNVQRLLMLRDSNQGKNSFAVSMLVYVILMFLIISIGLVVTKKYTGINGDQGLALLIYDLMPKGLIGLSVVCIIAILMSSADSYICAGGVFFVNDFLLPIFSKNGKKHVSEKTKLLMAKVSTALLGILAVIASLYMKNIFKISVIYKSIWFTSMLIPLYFTIFNKKLPKWGFYTCVCVGFFSMLLWNTFASINYKIYCIFFGLTINLLTGIFIHCWYCRNKVFQ